MEQHHLIDLKGRAKILGARAHRLPERPGLADVAEATLLVKDMTILLVQICESIEHTQPYVDDTWGY